MPFGSVLASIVGLCLCQGGAGLAGAPRRAPAGAPSDPPSAGGRSASVRAAPLSLPQTGAALTARRAPATEARAKLEIHYEMLCPYCSELIGQSLQTIWNDSEFRKRIDVAMFPAGNMNAIPAADVSEGYKFFHPELVEKGLGHVFQCQHGEQECLGNMVQACVMKVMSEPEDHLPIIFCMEAGASDGSSVEKVAFECMEEAEVDAAEVLNCTRTASANAMMYLISNYSNSLSPQRQYVPWVTINGQHFEEADGGDLLGPLCRSLSAPLPTACKQAGGQPRGIAGKIGHWFGGIQQAGSVGAPRRNRSAEFCYP